MRRNQRVNVGAVNDDTPTDTLYCHSLYPLDNIGNWIVQPRLTSNVPLHIMRCGMVLFPTLAVQQDMCETNLE